MLSVLYGSTVLVWYRYISSTSTVLSNPSNVNREIDWKSVRSSYSLLLDKTTAYTGTVTLTVQRQVQVHVAGSNEGMKGDTSSIDNRVDYTRYSYGTSTYSTRIQVPSNNYEYFLRSYLWFILFCW